MEVIDPLLAPLRYVTGKIGTSTSWTEMLLDNCADMGALLKAVKPSSSESWDAALQGWKGMEQFQPVSHLTCGAGKHPVPETQWDGATYENNNKCVILLNSINGNSIHIFNIVKRKCDII